jgi:16S rRNA G1207 methylase RsmC
VDEDAADTFLKNQKLKEAERYTFKLKSPTQVEEILAEKLKSSTRTANRFNELVSRSSAQKTLALASDKREAVAAVSEVMPDIEEIEDYEI